MEKLLYESNGTPGKRAKLLRIFSGILIACGVLLMMLGAAAPSYVSGKEMILVMGFVFIGLGGLFWAMPSFDYASKAYLRLYENHVEGCQVGPKREFQLDYAQIYNVRKTSLVGNDFVVIETANDTFTVLVDDQEMAYWIIDQKFNELEKA